MMMKKTVLTVLALLICATAFAAGGGQKSGGAVPEVNLWTSGSDNVRLIFEKLVDEFNKDPAYNTKAFMKLQYMPSGGGNQTIMSRLLAAYQSGQKNTTYDLAEFGESDGSAYLAEGGDKMFHKLDVSKIPNLKNVTARPSIGQEYFVPYRGTTVVIAYNSETVPNPPKTTAELTAWIKANPGRFAYNSPDSGGAGGAFATTGVYNFLPAEALASTDPKWKDQWGRGFDYLKEIHPYLYKSSGKVVYPNKNQGTLDLLASKEIDMAPAWADQSLTGIKNGTLPASTKIYQIEPALTGSLQILGIPTFGSQSEAAYAFIDFLLTPKAQNILLAEMAAIPLIPGSMLDTKEAAAVKDLDVSAFRINTIGELGQELYRVWNETIAVLP
ncbi:MAG: extracellular solute-binding protein [Treponema sp.]|jgi:putative spermidine/putrescine transport system substrate-binding protein|nr:extracellular solute-binding protein [Treponema sp.]